MEEYNGPSISIRRWADGHKVEIAAETGTGDSRCIVWIRDDSDLAVETNGDSLFGEAAQDWYVSESGPIAGNLAVVKLATEALAALVPHIGQIWHADDGEASCPALATFIEIAGDLAEFAAATHKDRPAQRDALQALAEEALDNCK